MSNKNDKKEKKNVKNIFKDFGYNVKINKPINEKDFITKKKTSLKAMYYPFNKGEKPSDEEIEKIPEYVFHNFLSSDKDLIDFALFFTIYKVPIKNQLQFIDSVVENKMYIKYEKLPEKDKEFENKIKIIQEYYNVNEYVAKEYLEILPDKEFQKIKNVIKTNEGKIK